MAVVTSSRLSSLSLFDQQMLELMIGVRVVGRDLGSSENERDQEKIASGERAHGNGNIFSIY